MTIGDLIRARQSELMARLDGMQKAAQMDSGGLLPDRDLYALHEELLFLTVLAREYLAHLDSLELEPLYGEPWRPDEPILTHPPLPQRRGR